MKTAPSIEQVRNWTSTLIALLIGAAGWYYLFYSRAAQRLAVIEAQAPNARRVRLRRINGVAMIFLAILIYVGSHWTELEQRPALFGGVWLAVILLLAVIVLLGLLDIRLTMELRRRRDEDRTGRR